MFLKHWIGSLFIALLFGLLSFSVVATESVQCHSCHLDKGWNLISVHADSSDSIASILASTPKVISVWGMSDNVWHSYHPATPEVDVNPLSMVDPSKGYWVLMSEDATDTFSGSWSRWGGEVSDLSSGWNLLGVEGAENNLAGYLEQRDADALWSWDRETWKSYQREVPVWLNSLRDIQIGDGVFLYMTRINHRPQVTNSSFLLDEDILFSGQLLGSDQDVSDTLVFRLVTEPMNGTVVVESSGGFTYHPQQDFYGTDQFVFTLNDGRVDAQAPATVTLAVSPQPDEPQALPMTLSMETSGGVTGSYLRGDDPDGSNKVFTIQAQPLRGTVVLEDGGLFFYTPNSGESGGEDQFTYQIQSGGESDSATVTIQLTASSTSGAWDELSWDQGAWE